MDSTPNIQSEPVESEALWLFLKHFSCSISSFSHITSSSFLLLIGLMELWSSKRLLTNQIILQHIRQAGILDFSTFLSRSLSASYPPRRWWAPGGAATWSRRPPAPRYPPSASPPSPRSRSASLHPRPTPRHHAPTRTLSLSRPPLPRGCCSSCPAPTPVRHWPWRTCWAPPGTCLPPARSQNPVWERLRLDKIMRKRKIASGLCQSGSDRENIQEKKVHRCSSQSSLLFPLVLQWEAAESLLVSDSLLSFWLPHCKVKGGKMRGSGSEWGGRGSRGGGEGRCRATVENLMSWNTFNTINNFRLKRLNETAAPDSFSAQPGDAGR